MGFSSFKMIKLRWNESLLQHLWFMFINKSIRILTRMQMSNFLCSTSPLIGLPMAVRAHWTSGIVRRETWPCKTKLWIKSAALMCDPNYPPAPWSTDYLQITLTRLQITSLPCNVITINKDLIFHKQHKRMTLWDTTAIANNTDYAIRRASTWMSAKEKSKEGEQKGLGRVCIKYWCSFLWYHLLYGMCIKY